MKKQNRGFTILEAVIAILIISGVSVAAISTILALRSLSNRYYQSMLAYQEMENVSVCIERDGSADAYGFLGELAVLYGEDASSYYDEIENNGDTGVYRIYYDEFFRPTAAREGNGESALEAPAPVYYMDISVNSGESQTIRRCTDRIISAGSEPQVPAGTLLHSKTTEVRETGYTVVETLTIEDDGTEQMSYEISGGSGFERESTVWYLDLKRHFEACRTDKKTPLPEETDDYSALTQDEVKAKLSRCFGLDGKLYGDVLCQRRIAAYRLCVYRIDADRESVFAQSDRVIRRTLSETDGDGNPVMKGGIGDSVGRSLGFSGGDGSSASPFLIGSARELRAMQKLSMQMRPLTSSVREDESYLVFDETEGSVYSYGTALDYVLLPDTEICAFVLPTPEPAEAESGAQEPKDDEPEAETSQVFLCARDEQSGALSVTFPEDVTPEDAVERLAAAHITLFRICAQAEPRITLPAGVDFVEVGSRLEAESRMLRRNYYYFRLTDNIDLSGCEGTLCEYFCGSFDGDGYQLTAGKNRVCLFGTLSADSVIANLDLIENAEGLVTLAQTSGSLPNEREAVTRVVLRLTDFVAASQETPEDVPKEQTDKDPDAAEDQPAGETESTEEEAIHSVPFKDEYHTGDAILFESITVYGVLRTGDCEAPFLRRAHGSRTTFRECNNYADVISYAQAGCAVYVAEEWDISADLVFETCRNFGTVCGEHAALFVACAPRGGREDGAAGTMSMTDSCSFGAIVGVQSAGYVYGCEEDFAFSELGGSYAPAYDREREKEAMAGGADTFSANTVIAQPPRLLSSLAADGAEQETEWTISAYQIKPDDDAPDLLTAVFSLPDTIEGLGSQMPEAMEMLLQFNGAYTDADGVQRTLLVQRLLEKTEPSDYGAAETKGPVQSLIPKKIDAAENQLAKIEYTASFHKVRFLDERTATELGGWGGEQDRKPEAHERGVDLNGGVAYSAYEVKYGAQEETQSECWYVFDLPEGLRLNYAAECTAVICGVDAVGLGRRDDADNMIIGFGDRVIGFAR